MQRNTQWVDCKAETFLSVWSVIEIERILKHIYEYECIEIRYPIWLKIFVIDMAAYTF